MNLNYIETNSLNKNQKFGAIFLHRYIIPICNKSKLGQKQIGDKYGKNRQIGNKNKKPQFEDQNSNLFSQVGKKNRQIGIFLFVV